MQTLSNDRIGNFTASSGHKLFTGGKTSETYIFEKAEEKVTGRQKEFSNKHTDHGLIYEAEALHHFTELTGLLCESLGNEYFPINENCGATPDAKIVNFDNVILASVDAKCPTTTFFKQKIDFIRQSKPKYQHVPKEYFIQGQLQMMALTAHNLKLGHPPVLEHYLVRYLTSSDTDYFGNTIEYDLPLEERIFYQNIVADFEIQEQFLQLVDNAVLERDIVVKLLKSTFNQLEQLDLI
ncbi:MAG: YqaJ viral recombinase family protein [Bacteroidia bacterium]